MKCQQCGANNLDTLKRCIQCGADLTAQTPEDEMTAAPEKEENPKRIPWKECREVLPEPLIPVLVLFLAMIAQRVTLRLFEGTALYIMAGILTVFVLYALFRLETPSVYFYAAMAADIAATSVLLATPDRAYPFNDRLMGYRLLQFGFVFLIAAGMVRVCSEFEKLSKHWRRTAKWCILLGAATGLVLIGFLIFGYGGFEMKLSLGDIKSWLLLLYTFFMLFLEPLTEIIIYILLFLSFRAYFRIWRERCGQLKESSVT